MGEGQPDGEDGSVGPVGHARGGRVRRGPDGHGVGTRGAAAVVLMPTHGDKHLLVQMERL